MIDCNTCHEPTPENAIMPETGDCVTCVRKRMKATESPAPSGQMDCLVMPLGMTKTPEGWPIMADSFLSFAFYAIGKAEIVEEFENETGNKFDSIFAKTSIEMMIDKATGNTNKMLSKFMDWLVVSHWGEA